MSSLLCSMGFCTETLKEIFPAYMWEYNGPMQIVNFPQQNYNVIGASGECPHCSAISYMRPFNPTTEVIYTGNAQTGQKLICPAQCESCKGWVLIVGWRVASNDLYRLQAVYPMGKPKDSVDEAVPKNIAEDFAEALRCQWINAYKACVTMCRRAIQASALALGASPNKRLVDQIDELFTKGKITETLKDFAHEIRLTGNDGAHPDKDGLENVKPEDAEDMVAFARQYLEHVYIMPAKLQTRKQANTPKKP